MIGTLFRYAPIKQEYDQMELFQNNRRPLPGSYVLVVQSYNDFCAAVLSDSGVHVVPVRYLQIC
jgi:hypothetical protein